MNLPVASDEFINVIYRNILKALAVIYTLLTVMPTQCFYKLKKMYLYGILWVKINVGKKRF